MPLPLPSMLGVVAVVGTSPEPEPDFIIDIFDTENNILLRTGDQVGTVAFGTDTNALYIYNSEGFDKWSEFDTED
tara:strand:- start:2219 stop:2443 length:225 start_codon:yes stop_codon:yes gene_type:complete